MPGDVPLLVPFEYRKAGISTPEAAATYSAGIIGFVVCHRAQDSAERAEQRAVRMGVAPLTPARSAAAA